MKKRFLILFFILVFILSSCGTASYFGDGEGSEIVISSPNVKIPIEGSWKLVDRFSMDSSSKKSDLDEMYSDLYIADNLVAINEKFTMSPTFSSKYVDKDTYFKSRFITIPDYLNIKDNNIVVLRIDDNNMFSQEIIRVSEDRLYLVQSGIIFIYDRVEDRVSKKILQEYKKIQDNMDENVGLKTEDSPFGLVLGVRKKIGRLNPSDYFNYDYKTFYIGITKEGNRAEITAVENILIPKDSGFWVVRNDRTYDDNLTIDRISAMPLALKDKENINYIEDILYRRIDYVGKDFIGLTKANPLTDTMVEEYEIYNIHNLAKKTPVKISDIAGNDGLLSYKMAMRENLEKIYEDDLGLIEYKVDEKNIGIKREKGNWKFLSNIDIKVNEDDNIRTYHDFTLDIIPTVDVFPESNNTVKWTEIINRVPGALDYIISPDSRYILIQGETEMSMFRIFNNSIESEPMFSIQNAEGYEIVMNQWSDKENAKLWLETFSELDILPTQTIYSN